MPSKQLEEVLKQHPKAVLLDREQYEALIKDAGKLKPDDQEKPPLGAVFTGAKLEAHLVPGSANVMTKGLLHVTSFSDGWTELPALKSFERSLLTSITGDHLIAKNGNAKNEGLRIAVHGKGDHQIAVEFQSSVYRRNGYCYTFLPAPLQPLSLTARIENGIHLARDWPEHEGVAIIPTDHTNSAYVLWTESAEKNRNDDSTMTQTIKAVTVLGGSELNTHLQVHLESKGNSMPQILSFQLPDTEVNVVTLEGSGIASWKQSGAFLEVNLDPSSRAFRADFTATLNRGAPALEKPADIPLDLPRLKGASRISVQSAVSVGSGFEMLGYQIPGDAKDADAVSFEKYASSIRPISAKANYAQLPSKLAVKVRRLSDLFSADVDNLVTLYTHEMMMQRTIVVHGEEGRVNKVELTVPANEQFIGLGAASGEPVQWKQTSFQDQGSTLEVTWPNGLQKGQSTALWLTTRHELPSSLAAESAKPNPNAPGAKFTINNVLLPSATRIAGYVALNFDESWKVVTPEMSGLESRDARVTPVKGQMAWFTLRDYKLGIQIARNEPVLDAEVIAYALPRAKQVEIEGQFTLSVSRAPLRKFDVKLPVSSAKLLRVDSPLIGEQQLDEATGVWHFTLRKELQGTANVRWRLNEKAEDQRSEAPNAENPKLKIQNPKLAATLPRFEFPSARRFTGEWVIEANTDTELSYDTKGVQPLDSTHAPAVEGYQPRHRVLAAFAYGAAAHEVKITATRHEASALISAVVEQMNLTSVLSTDGSSRHEAALIVKHNGQQFFGLRLPKGAALLSAAVAGNAVKPVRAGDEEVRVPLSGGSAQSGSLAVKFVYEMTGNKWGSSGKQQLQPPSLGENVPVLSASWKVYAPEGMEYQTSGGLAGLVERKETPVLVQLLGHLQLIPEDYAAQTKLVAGLKGNASPRGDEVISNLMQTEFFGTQIEVIEGGELHRRTLERLHSLHPELTDQPITVQAKQTPGSSIITIGVLCEDKMYAWHFVNALSDEYIALRKELIDAGLKASMNSNSKDLGNIERLDSTTTDIVAIMERSPKPASEGSGEASMQQATSAQYKRRPSMEAPTVTTLRGQRAEVQVTRNLDLTNQAEKGAPNGRIISSKSGLISLDLTLPITGAFFEFSGHQKPETLTLAYQSWERQMFKAVLSILVGMALFLRWGRRRAWMKTFALVLLLTCVPLIIAPSWLAFCNALLAGWLVAFGGWLILGIAKWVEAKASSFGFRGSLRESFMVVLLTTLCTSALHAEMTETKDPAAHTVIVPYDIGKPLDLKQSNRFYLDYAEFQHLWDLAKENRRPAKPIVEAGPQEALINSALYDAEILADRFVMNARLSVVTRGGSWVKLPLGFKADGLFISEVKVDGKSAVLEKEEVLIEEPGPHMVEVSLQVLKKAGWQDLRMELPKSPANLIALTISEQEGRPSFNSFDFMVTEDKRAGRRVFILPMIMNSPLEFKREPLRQFVAEAAPTSSENKVSLNVLPRLEKVSAEIAFAFAGKERSSFSVRFDGSLKPTLWQVSYLKQWMLRKDGRDWVADITLTRSVVDKFQIRLDAERIFPDSTGSREAPRVVGYAVKSITLFSIDHAEDLTVKTMAASSIQRTDVANNKSGAKSNRETYQWLNNEPLSYLVANAEDRSASQIEAVYQLSAQKAEIIAAITLETGRGPLDEARVKLPQGFEVQSLAGPRVLSWHREGDEVLMLFDSQAVSNARLVVHVAKTLTKTTNTWKLESLLTPQFAKHKGTALIATHAADEVTLSFDASDRKLREVDPSTLNAVITVAAPLVVKRALLTEKSNWSAQVGLNRQSPKFSVDAVLLAQATDEGLKLSQQIGLNIEQGALGGVKLRLPKQLPEARVRGALVRDAQSKLIGEVREYEVKFQEDVLERADFTLDLELPLEGEKTLPVVQVDGASRAQRFLIVDNTSSKEMKTDTGGAESIIKDSLPYLPDGLQRPEYYRAGDTAKIKLGFNQLETTAGNAAIITLAEITTALRENGERWETVVYSIANRALQFLPVRLPANAELVEVSVGGQTVRADVDGSKKASGQVYLVPLIQMRAGELSQQVRLVYRLPASEKSVVTKHTLDDPELVGLSAERTLWNVWLPEPFELKKWDGNMEDVGEEGREVEKQQSLLSDLNRLNQVLSSKDLKAEDANVAWANANKVVGELKHQQQEKKSKKSYFSRSDEGKAKELPQQAARQSIAIANAEVDKQLDVQGSLLISNSSNVLRAQSQVEQGRNSFAGIVQGNINSNSGATQNWAFNGGNLTVQPKSESKPADMNQLAVNDNVNIGQGFLDDKGAASMKSEPQGATLTKSGAGTLTLGSGVATFSGGLTLATPTQNASQSGLQNNATNNISSNARASKNAITANSATTLDLNGTNTYTGVTTINAGTTVSGGTLNLNGNVAGTGGLSLAGNGKLELSDTIGAISSVQNALGIDKDNQAARRGLEIAEKAKSLGIAKDMTRAKMLNSVSEGWESKVPAATLNKSGAVATGSVAATPDSIDGLFPKIATPAPAKATVVFETGNSSASAAADPFAAPAMGNSIVNSTTLGTQATTFTRAAVAAPLAGEGETESRNKALPATPQLKPVGRVSLAVEVPLEGTVHHFRKLKDHALIELTVIKPMESNQTSALWMLLIGGAILGGIEWARRWRAVK